MLLKSGKAKKPWAVVDMYRQFRDLMRIMRADPAMMDEIPILRRLALKAFALMCASELVATLEFIPVMFFFNELNSENRSVWGFFHILVVLAVTCYLDYTLELKKSIRRARLDWHQWFMWWAYGHRQELRQSIDWADRYSKGDRESMVEKNIGRFQGLIDQLMFVSVPAGTKILFVSIGMWFVGPSYGLIAILTLVMYGLSMVKTEKSMEAQREESREQIRQLEIFGTELTNMYETIKHLGIEEAMSDLNDVMLRQFCIDQGVRDQHRLTRYSRQGGVLKISKLAMYGMIAVVSLRHDPNIGAMVVATAWMEQMHSHLFHLTNLQMYVSQGYVALKELVGMMQTVPSIRQPESPVSCEGLSPSIVVDNVSYAHPSDPNRLVLKNISLTINEGEVVAFVGPSGGGKSTLGKLIGRTDDPKNGSIMIDGVDLRDLDYYQLRKFVGGVSQRFDLFSMSIRDNIAVAMPGATFDDIVRAAKLADAHDFIMKLPERYDTQAGEGGGRLSGGERQRIAIARSLSMSYQVAVYDEATSALDAHTQVRVQRGINTRIAELGQTSIIIAHRISTIRNVDRVFVIDDGQIVEQGAPDWLYSQNGEFTRLCDEEAAAMVAV